MSVSRDRDDTRCGGGTTTTTLRGKLGGGELGRRSGAHTPVRDHVVYTAPPIAKRLHWLDLSKWFDMTSLQCL